MKKALQILLLTIFTISIPTESYSFIGTLAKGGKIIHSLSKSGSFFFKTKIWKAGGISAADSVAVEALNIRKINKNLIGEIGKTEHGKIFRSIKDSPDEIILSEYKHYDDVSINDVELYRLLIPRPAYRHLAKDLKPENSIYACEKNTGEIFYFSIMPKRNKALVSSSDKMVGKQRLIILYSKPKGTILKTKEPNNSNNYFVLLPNYKFYSDASNSLENLVNKMHDNTIPINGECYDTDVEDKTLVRYESDKKITLVDEKQVSLKIPLIIFFVTIAWFTFGHFFHKNISRTEKRFLKFINLYILVTFISVVLINIVSWGSLLTVFTFNLAWYFRSILIFIFVLYVFYTYTFAKRSYEDLKIKYKGKGAQKMKIINYLNFVVPIFFVLIFFILYNL